MRKNGFQLPLDPHQVGAIILCSALISCCYALQLPFVEGLAARIVLLVLYTFLVVSAIVLFIYCGITDPSDPGLTNGLRDGEFYCAMCQAHVGKTSKHCRACDKCVEGFDHHCKWLNNCVGSKTYKQFFLLVCGTVSVLTLQLAWALWQFTLSFADKSDMQMRVYDKYKSSVNYHGWQAMLALYIVLLVLAVIMLGELCLFHIVLMVRGITTYDYIIWQREQQMAGEVAATSSCAGLIKQLVTCQACMHRNKVHDTSAAKARPKVGLNICAACHTHKPEGNPNTWQNQGLGTPPKPGKPGSCNVAGGGSGRNSLGNGSGRGEAPKYAKDSKDSLSGVVAKVGGVPHTPLEDSARNMAGNFRVRASPHLSPGGLPMPASYTNAQAVPQTPTPPRTPQGEGAQHVHGAAAADVSPTGVGLGLQASPATGGGGALTIPAQSPPQGGGGGGTYVGGSPLPNFQGLYPAHSNQVGGVPVGEQHAPPPPSQGTSLIYPQVGQ